MRPFVALLLVQSLAAAIPTPGAPRIPLTTSSEVSFRLASEHAPLIIVPVMLNGQGPFDFILDTGASSSMVSPALAKKLKLDGGQEASGLGAGGAVKMQIFTTSTFSVGAAKEEHLELAAGDLSAIAKEIDAKVDGIVGYNFLRSYRVTLDYPRRKLTLAR